jgi:hypothetical protein
MQEKNALTKMAQGPMHAFKGNDVTLVLEKLLGMLGLQRRNQIIRFVGNMNSNLVVNMIREYGMYATIEEYKDVALAIVDNREPVETLELWKKAKMNAMITAVRFPTHTIDMYNTYVDVGKELGCVPVIVSDGMIVFVRRNLAHDVGIKGINLRNTDIVFYDA